MIGLSGYLSLNKSTSSSNNDRTRSHHKQGYSLSLSQRVSVDNMSFYMKRSTLNKLSLHLTKQGCQTSLEENSFHHRPLDWQDKH